MTAAERGPASSAPDLARPEPELEREQERDCRDQEWASNGGPERGVGSILAVAIMAAVLLLVSLSAPLYTGLIATRRAQAAADASALAAADVAVGIVAGVPCTRAAEVARANGATLLGCGLDGAVATVRVSVALGGLGVAAAASAGPPVGADR